MPTVATETTITALLGLRGARGNTRQHNRSDRHCDALDQ